MSRRARALIATAIGVGLVAAHAAVFVALAHRADGSELVAALFGPIASPASTPTIGARLPADLAARVTTDDNDGTPPGPGLHRRRWSVRYRGDFVRAVGAAQLVGPFQDPAAPPCSGRVIVGQRLLDDGHASRGTLANILATALDAEMRGDSYFGAGDFERVSHVSLAWAELAAHPDDRAMLGAAGAPHGYARATATVEMERVDLPIVVALVPTLGAGALHFRIAARAELAFGNRFVQWASDHLGGDRLATRLARRELDGAILDTLAPPPSFALPGGQQLRFTFCDEGPTIVDGAYAALPFAVAFGTLPTAPTLRPPMIGRGPFAPVSPATRLAIDVDVDALDAMLFELWRTGVLDRQLAAAGLDVKFNDDPTVQSLLSVRISPVVLGLPPVVVAVGDHLRLSAETRLAIGDGDGAPMSTARLWGGLDFRFSDAATMAPKHSTSSTWTAKPRATALPIAVDLGALELSCERSSMVLVPCYADLVAALRDRSADAHGALTQAFASLLGDIFVERRLATDALPAQLVIHAAHPTLLTAPPTATVRLELDAELVAPKP